MSPACAPRTNARSSAEERSFSLIFLTAGKGQLFSHVDVSQLAFGAGKFARNARISLTGNIYCFGEGFEKGFDDVMGFVAVKQFQVQIAAGFVGKALEEFAGQAEA